MQQAFLDLDGFQCGYCTPGRICSAIEVIEEHAAGRPSAVTDDVRPEAAPPPLTPEEIRERMSGNLCRCGAYVSIAAEIVATRRGGTGVPPTGSGTPIHREAGSGEPWWRPERPECLSRTEYFGRSG